MEEKVEHILKIIEEDGDSFAQRAEMYYRKRPELLNFVEDSFRGYRALADRYEQLSKELQSANRTIATVYPEQVQLAMRDEDENLNIPSTQSGEPSKNLPDVPKISIPKKNTNQARIAKVPSRVMSKKGLLKFNVPKEDTKSGTAKEEALKKIDEIQKTILGFQTEKEFVQSVYENGLAKYWEIEEKINDMQSKVNVLQDEFGVGTFIEDDEARTVMAATAIKTCQDTLTRLQDLHNQSEEEAKIEYERVKQVQKKLVIIKENMISHERKEDAIHENLELEEKMENENKIEKIKEQANSTTPVTMSEMAERIDDLVEKVISLETALSSQNALVARLRSETDYLQAQIERIEQDKEALAEGSDGKNDKIVELESELLRIKSLNQSFKNENRNLQKGFTEASFTAGDLSEKLKTVKQDDEVHLVKDLENGSPSAQVKDFQDLKTSNKILKVSDSYKGTALQNRSMITEDINPVSSHPVNEVPISTEEKNISNSDPCVGHQGTISHSHDSDISNKGIGEVVKTDNNFVHHDSDNGLDDILENGQAMSNPSDHTAEEKKTDCHDFHEMGEQNFFSFNPFDFNEGTKEHDNDLAVSTGIQIGKDEKSESQDQVFNTRNPSDYLSPEKAMSNEHESEEDDQPNWKELFLNGLEDREKVLLQEYTATMRNYKETRKQLHEMEKINHDSLFMSESQIKELKTANALKDEEIKSLHKKLDMLQVCLDENPETTSTDGPHQQSISEATMSRSYTFSLPSVDQDQEEQKVETAERKEQENQEDTDTTPVKYNQSEKWVAFDDQPDDDPTVQEKFRSDIDGLLEENIEFWMRFSTSFQQIQKFQTSVEDLQDELTKLRETRKQDGSSKQTNSDIRPIYNHLREIQTELTLWSEQNSLLEFDLQHRLKSLSRLQEEISKSENQGNGMSDNQAAKFQGEILNMKHENNQVAERLKFGLERVKELHNEIAKTVSNLEEELGVSEKKNEKDEKSSSGRSKVPLKSLLFGNKTKKQKPSFFHCMNPALQKQYSDLQSGQK